MKKHRIAPLVATLAALSTPALGQNFNIDVGMPGSQPPSSYGGAGLPGVWNSVLADHVSPFTPGPTPQDDMLVDLQGNPTAVGFHQFGGMELITASDPSVSGADAALLNDYVVTHNALENCMYLNGLQNGTYEVITYAWMPDHPETDQVVRFDFHPGSTPVGGAWSGGHVEGVTYSRDIVEVTSGNMGFHVGLGVGEPAEPGAAFNAVQVRLLGTPVPALPRAALVGFAVSLAIAGAFVASRRRRVAPVEVRRR